MSDSEFFTWVDEVVVANMGMAVAGYIPTTDKWRVELTPCLGETMRAEDPRRGEAFRRAKELYLRDTGERSEP